MIIMEGEIKPGSVKDLKVGSYVMIDDEPCKVTNISFSSPGKHGAAKARVEAIGVFDNQKRSFVGSSDNRVNIPIIEKKYGQVLTVTPNMVQVMDNETFEIFEIEPPSDAELKAGYVIEYLCWGSRRKFSRVVEKNE